MCFVCTIKAKVDLCVLMHSVHHQYKVDACTGVIMCIFSAKLVWCVLVYSVYHQYELMYSILVHSVHPQYKVDVCTGAFCVPPIQSWCVYWCILHPQYKINVYSVHPKYKVNVHCVHPQYKVGVGCTGTSTYHKYKVDVAKKMGCLTALLKAVGVPKCM